MSEWQPARYVDTGLEAYDDPLLSEFAANRHGKLIHVRPIDNSAVLKPWGPCCGNNARFFQVQEEPLISVCEHEILTD